MILYLIDYVKVNNFSFFSQRNRVQKGDSKLVEKVGFSMLEVKNSFLGDS